MLLFTDTLPPRDTVGLCSVFWRTILGYVAETATVSLRTLDLFFPLVTDTFSSFNAD